MEEPLYKVGDTVTIKQLSLKDTDDYRYGLNSDMIAQSGKTFEIVSIEPSGLPDCKIFDDGFRYRLKGIGWSWVSSMFEESSAKMKAKSKTKKSKTKISFHKNKKLKFNFSL